MGRHLPVHERLWGLAGAEDECWEFTGPRDQDGYGQITIAGKRRRAHRVAFEIVAEERLPPGVQVLHTCDNPPCCNPAHLVRGDNAANVADRVAKGRGARGARVNTARLSAADVERIRERLAVGETQTALAAEHGITKQSIWAIAHGKTWRRSAESVA